MAPVEAAEREPLLPSSRKMTQKQNRRGVARRNWAVRVVSKEGSSELMHCSRQALIQRTGVPERDLRLQGPLLCSASVILGREGCIMVNLEHIKAIVTAEEAVIMNPTDAAVLNFISLLQKRLAASIDFQKRFKTESEAVLASEDPSGLEHSRAPPAATLRLGNPASSSPGHADVDVQEALPFEFQVLEAILEASIGRLEQKWKQLQAEAYPALDQLTRRVTTSSLELVRSIKATMTQLTSQAQKVRDEIERLLDDDQDMGDLYLTRRLTWLRLPDSPSSSACPSGRASFAQHRAESLQPTLTRGGSTALGALGAKTMSLISTNPGGKDVQELEMLLEAYFMQVEGVLNGLSALHEYVHNTEDYVNIHLDYHRNQLQGLNMLLTAAGTILALVLVFLGLYSMNLPNVLYSVDGIFVEVVASLAAASVVLFAGFVYYVRRTQMVTF